MELDTSSLEAIAGLDASAFVAEHNVSFAFVTAEKIAATLKAATEVHNGDKTFDAIWIFFGACGVFLMQAGFAMLEAGALRAKSVRNILLKNLVDVCAGAAAFWIFGYAFAYGEAGGGNAFIGNTHFFLTNGFTDYVGFFFQWAFCATCATIVSGALAERTQFRGYLVYTVMLTSFIYPVVVHWVWAASGFLTAFGAPETRIGEIGAVDFAGSMVVHGTGGIVALAGAIMVGPRIGRFDTDENGKMRPIRGHSVSLYSLGTLILFFGWLFFNSASTLAANGGAIDLAAKVAANTVISGGFGGLAAVVMERLSSEEGHWSLQSLCNGILSGLVSITAPCSVVDLHQAAMIGVIGGVLYVAGSRFLIKARIDDPLDASVVHGFCGAWGVLSVGFFATKENLIGAYGAADTLVQYGIFEGGRWHLLWTQILCIVVITAWAGVFGFGTFFLLKLVGWLRVSAEVEEEGLDVHHHAGLAQAEEFDQVLRSLSEEELDDKRLSGLWTLDSRQDNSGNSHMRRRRRQHRHHHH